MDYLRNLGKPKHEHVTGEDSPISDIDDDADGKCTFYIDDAIKAVLDAAGRAAAPTDARSSTQQMKGAANDTAGYEQRATTAVEGNDVEMSDGTRAVQKEVEQQQQEEEVEELVDEAAEGDEGKRRKRERQPSPEASQARVIKGNEIKPNITTTTASAASNDVVTNSYANNSDAIAAPPAPAPPAIARITTAPINNPSHARDAHLTGVHTHLAPAPTLPTTPPPPRRAEIVSIVIRDTNNFGTVMRCKPETKLYKLFQAYADRHHADVRYLRFISQHGFRLPSNDRHATVRSVGLDDDDEIDMMLEQIGGA